MKIYDNYRDIPDNVMNLLKNNPYYKPHYQWTKRGVYILYGPLEGVNLNTMYIDNPEKVLDYLDNILDYEGTPIKLKEDTKSVINYLLDNETEF